MTLTCLLPFESSFLLKDEDEEIDAELLPVPIWHIRVSCFSTLSVLH